MKLQRLGLLDQELEHGSMHFGGPHPELVQRLDVCSPDVEDRRVLWRGLIDVGDHQLNQTVSVPLANEAPFDEV